MTMPTMCGPDVQQSITERLTRPDLGRWLGQVQQVRHCARPIRLVGHTETIDRTTGEVLRCYDTTTEPDGIACVRCGSRRAAVCPSCSHEYKGDVWHVLMAGAAGGMKKVPDTVAAHPLVFATLTAPSFGPVHTAKKPGRPGSRRCQPRSRERRQLCPHGRPTWCMAIHDHTAPQAGQPLCGDCYDYLGHLVWQWWHPNCGDGSPSPCAAASPSISDSPKRLPGVWSGSSSPRSPSSNAAD
jgi:hypothetical protein